MMLANRGSAARAGLLLILAVLLPLTVFAAPQTYRIDLPTRTLTPTDDGGQWLAQRAAGEASSIILQFRNHPTDIVKRSLSQAGVQLQEYIGGSAWVAYVQPGVQISAFDNLNLRWAGPMLPEDKVDLRVAVNQLPSWAITPDGNIYAVVMMKNISEDEAELLIHEAGGEPGAVIGILNTWHVLGDPTLPARLAEDPRVHFVTAISPPMAELNAGVRAAMNVDEVNNPPYDFDGEGETVCVYDGGLVDLHPDFEDRLTQGEGGAVAAHSTHVAGTVGGNGPDAYRGMAPAVSLISFFYEACDPYCLYDSPQDIYENYESAYGMGARLFTNSIGANIYSNGYDCDWQGDYELTSALIDSLVRGPFGEPLTITWAAGNERSPGTPCNTAYESMSVPSCAKNSIVVGATTDGDGMTNFSSWGPTDDGRLKPDVTAPGSGVYSCNAGGGYTQMSGTSMATPAVAGVNALLLQAYHSRVNPDTSPLPETMKAILCNSAEDLGFAGPDYQFGFGRVDAQRAVDTILNFGLHEGTINDDDVLTHTFSVPEGLEELWVTLAWSDVPAGYLPDFALVNDLDMILSDPGNLDYFPFVLDPANPGTPATTGVNTLDNVEKIVVSNPSPGEWTLTIQGTDIQVGPQTFGVAANVPMVAGVTAVHGTVTDAVSGDPIPSVQLGLETANGTVNAQTLADGTFLFYTVLNGDSRMSITRGGYWPQQVWVIDDGDGEAVFDIQMQPGVSGEVAGIVLGPTGIPIPTADIFIEEYPDIFQQTDLDGLFDLEFVPANEAITVVMEYNNATFRDEAQLFLAPGDSVYVTMYLIPEGNAQVGPDEYGYVAIQSSHDNPNAPEYDWIAIDPLEGGPGTRITTSSEDTPVLLDLPFNFTYYDTVYNEFTVNENGFFCFGDVTDDPDAADYSNSTTPAPDGPPALIGPFWEDMYALETNLSYYHDSDNGLFIIEWYETRQYSPADAYETFQVVLFDPAFYPDNGYWGHILFQYNDITDLGNATVGIEDETETMGLNILYFDHDGNGGYNENAETITDTSAILFYRPSANIEGNVTLDPPNAQAEVTITIGYQSMTANGDFTFTDVMPGFTVIDFSLEGYEHFQMAVELPENGTVTLDDVVMTRLDSPLDVHYEELNGSFDNGASVYWTAPIFGGEIDEFLGAYRVYRNGQMIVQTEELNYADSTPYVDGTMYWVTAMYAGGESDSSMHATYLTGISEKPLALPQEFEVAAPWPNPFNPSTAISIALPERAELDVAVFDLLGREVVRLADRQTRQAGYHRLVWDATGHASGVYFIRVNAGPNKAVRKVMLLK